MSPTVAAKTRHAFTVMELLTVVSIVGVLASLVLPALLEARESARRSRCAANLRVFGIALQSFDDIHQRLPRLFCGIDGKVGHATCLSPHARLLPGIGHGDLHAAIDFDDKGVDFYGDPPSTGTNSTGMSTSVNEFICPSDPLPGRAMNSYRFCRGTISQWPENHNGGAFRSRRVTCSFIVDGLSHTVFMSERSFGAGPSIPVNHERNARLLSSTTSLTQTALVNECASQLSTSAGSNDVYIGASWLRGHPRHISYSHALPPNSRVADCEWAANFSEIITARSHHEGGVNVLYGDGHVNFISNSVALSVWRAIATIAGGEGNFL